MTPSVLEEWEKTGREWASLLVATWGKAERMVREIQRQQAAEGETVMDAADIADRMATALEAGFEAEKANPDADPPEGNEWPRGL